MAESPEDLRLDDEFETRVRASAWSDYFVADGHCNGRGYTLIGELVAARVARMLDR